MPQQYPFGSEADIERLRRQASLITPATDRLMQTLPFARVLRAIDVGSGAGDSAALLLSRAPSAKIIAIDRSLSAAVTADSQARTSGIVADAQRLPISEQSVDLVFGRFIAVYLPNLADVLRELQRVVKPSGHIAFVEWDYAHALPMKRSTAPRFALCHDWIMDTLASAGVPMDPASHVPAAFRASGLSPVVATERLIFPATEAASRDIASYVFETAVHLSGSTGRQLPRPLAAEAARDILVAEFAASTRIELNPLLLIAATVR